eukprot:scaffold29047_cov18-Prasinocladus_malaysianus.AAC.1
MAYNGASATLRTSVDTCTVRTQRTSWNVRGHQFVLAPPFVTESRLIFEFRGTLRMCLTKANFNQSWSVHRAGL